MSAEVVTGSGFALLGLEGKPVVRVGQQAPLAGRKGPLDPVFRGEAVLVASLTVAPPLNAINGCRFGQFQLNPPFALLVGDPTAVVSVFFVVEVNELVLWVVGVVSRGGQFGSKRRVAGFLTNGPYFQFVDTRFGAVFGGLGGETDEANFLGGEGLDVALEINCRAKGGWTGRGFPSIVGTQENDVGSDCAAGVSCPKNDARFRFQVVNTGILKAAP